MAFVASLWKTIRKASSGQSLQRLARRPRETAVTMPYSKPLSYLAGGVIVLFFSPESDGPVAGICVLGEVFAGSVPTLIVSFTQVHSAARVYCSCDKCGL